jgi:hypothetical protein
MSRRIDFPPSPLNLVRNYARGSVFRVLPFLLYYALLTLIILPARFGWSPTLALALVVSVVLIVSFNGLAVTLRAEGDTLVCRRLGIATKRLLIPSIGHVQCTAIHLFRGTGAVPIYRIIVSSSRGPWDLLYSFSGWGYRPATLANRLQAVGVACDDSWTHTFVGDLFDDDQGRAFPWVELAAYLILPPVLYFAALAPFVH